MDNNGENNSTNSVAGSITNNGRILHDAYFSKKPSLIALMLVRLALLCLMAVSTVLMFTDFYHLPCDRLTVGVIAASATAFVFLCASLLPQHATYAGIVVIGTGLFLVFKERVVELAEYFWDKMMLTLDSRLLATKDLVIHNRIMLEYGKFDNELEAGCFFGISVLSVLFAVIVTLSCRTRCRVFAPVCFTIITSAPAFAAEIAGYTPFAPLYIAAVFALRSVASSYELDSSFVLGGANIARHAEKRGERAYSKRTRFYAFFRRLRSDIPRYAKYTPNAVVTFVISAAVFFAAESMLPKDIGIDYTQVLDALSDFASETAEKIGSLWNDVTGRADERNYFSISNSSNISGSISISSPSNSEKEVLTVTLDRNDIPVYLRGDIGVSYTGRNWTSISREYDRFVDANGNKYSELLKDFYPEEEYRYFRRSLLTQGGISPDDVLPLQKVALEYKRNTRVVFQPLAPYELSYKESEFYDSFGDFILRTKPQNGYITTFESLALTPGITENSVYEGGMTAEAIALFAYNSEKEQRKQESDYFWNIDVYRDYINIAYMERDAVVDDLMAKLREEHVITSGSGYGAAAELCDYFRKNFTYSLEKENGGNDLYDFLYVTKRGHCALFASAMTLCLRDMGIPARYITGYVVSGDGEKTANGYSYTLKERDLHAWVEAYFEGVGWLPFDPTASVSESASDSAVTTAYDETDDPDDTDEDDETDDPNETTVPDETTAPDESDETDDLTTTVTDENGNVAPSGGGAGSDGSGNSDSSDDNSAGGFPLELLPFIIAGAVLLILILAAVLFVKAVNRAEKRTFDSFLTRSPTEATALMYRFILVLLANAGLVPQNELLFDFAHKVDDDPLMKGSNAFMRDIVPTIEKCEFGTEKISPVTEDERQAVYKYAAAVYLRYAERLHPVKLFFAKISLFM